MVCYDIYGTNEAIYDWLGMDKKDVRVDFYVSDNLTIDKPYLLATTEYPYKVIRTYSLEMFPIELNIKYKIQGKGIYLYEVDSSIKCKKVKMSLPLAYYYLKGFDIRLLSKYAVHYIKHKMLSKVKK